MYGVVKLAAVSAVLAVALIAAIEDRTGPDRTDATGRVTIETMPNSRNAPLAPDGCVDARSDVRQGDCTATEARTTLGPVRLAGLDRSAWTGPVRLEAIR